MLMTWSRKVLDIMGRRKQKYTEKERILSRLPIARNRREKRERTDSNKEDFREYVEQKDRKNPAFTNYYENQKITDSAEDFNALLTSLSTTLPASFRIHSSTRFAQSLISEIESNFISAFEAAKAAQLVNQQNGDENTGEEIIPPYPIKWFPDNLAWSTSAARQTLRRNELLKPFHQFLIENTACGSISRQEAVSMLPPLFLNVEPGMRVVDLCAAPGSKTSQIIDALSHKGSQRKENDQSATERNGLIVANDSDMKRCFMLVHQMKRLNSPELIVTHHDAQKFPAELDSYDRVLADVPCSGDGTLRKAPDMWKKWNPLGAISLHKLQIDIAKHGLNILKVGGRMVYSTCSLNPLENEAVVAELLRTYGDSIELLDVSSELPALKRRSGLTTWKVPNLSHLEDENAYFESFESVPDRRLMKNPRSLFPPDAEKEQDIVQVLPRVLRILPHDNDTGGFFVSVFRKLKPHKEENDLNSDQVAANAEPDADVAVHTADAENSEPPSKKKRYESYGSRLLTRDPLVSLFDRDPESAVWLSEFFGIDMKVVKNSLMLRASEATKSHRKVYFLSTAVRELIETKNESEKDETQNQKSKVSAHLRVVHAGIRVFERHTRAGLQGHYRAAYEGNHLIRPFMKKRVISVSTADFTFLLGHSKNSREGDGYTIFFTTFPAESQLVERLNGMDIGSVIFTNDGEALMGWKGNLAVSLLMNEDDLNVLRKLYRIPIPSYSKAEMKSDANEQQTPKDQEHDEGNSQEEPESDENADEPVESNAKKEVESQ